MSLVIYESASVSRSVAAKLEPDLSGFPPKAVFGPAFTPGGRGGVLPIVSARFTGLLPPDVEGAA